MKTSVAGLVAGRLDPLDQDRRAPPRWTRGRGRSRPRRRPSVPRPRSFSVPLSAWKISAPIRSASEKLGAPAGTTMNSWKSTELSAWAPPLSTFIIGTGSTVGRVARVAVELGDVGVERHPGLGRGRAGGRQRDAEDRVGAEPRLVRRPVELASGCGRSPPGRSARAPDQRLRRSSSLTFATALPTPLPAHASPPSRSSVASNSPVEAPEGTAARPRAPESSATSTSTVGLPRESRIWRAWMRSIAPIAEAREASGSASRRRSAAARRASSGSTPSRRESRTTSSSISPTARSASSRVARSAGDAALGLGAAQDLARVEQPGQVLGHVGERVVGAPALDLALDLVPVPQHLG